MTDLAENKIPAARRKGEGVLATPHQSGEETLRQRICPTLTDIGDGLNGMNAEKN